jgi:GH15 family glucan-1,4-alpha-glucosidase
MPDGLDLLTEIHTKVLYIADALETHIEHDEKIQQDFIRPLWETRMEQRGAAKFAMALYSVIAGFIGAIIGIVYTGHK